MPVVWTLGSPVDAECGGPARKRAPSMQASANRSSCRMPHHAPATRTVVIKTTTATADANGTPLVF
jgi:hypothetical protein